MHEASLEKMRAFRVVYLDDLPRPLRVLDVGSEAPRPDSYRTLFPRPDFDYVGLDIAQGVNVDLVPSEPYYWPEIERESFDAVISGQTFEHNPYFWLTMAEIARVLKVGGHLCLIAPSRGLVHRFPLDCWRFYPDAGAAMCGYVGLDLVESYVESRRARKVTFGQKWHDYMLIARKSQVDYAHLERITETRGPFPVRQDKVGGAIALYEREQELSSTRLVRAYLKAVTDRARRLFLQIRSRELEPAGEVPEGPPSES